MNMLDNNRMVLIKESSLLVLDWAIHYFFLRVMEEKDFFPHIVHSCFLPFMYIE